LAKQFKDLFFPQHLDITDDDLAYVVDYFTKLSNKPREETNIFGHSPILDSLIHFILEKRIPSLAIKYKELFLPQHLDVTDDDLQFMVDYFTKLSKKRGPSSDDSDLSEKEIKSGYGTTKNPQNETTTTTEKKTTTVPSASTESSSSEDDDTPVILTPVKKPAPPVVDLSSGGSESSSGSSSSSSDSDEETHPYSQTQPPPLQLPVPVPASRSKASSQSPYRSKTSTQSPHQKKAVNRILDRSALHPSEVGKKSRRPLLTNYPREKQQVINGSPSSTKVTANSSKRTKTVSPLAPPPPKVCKYGANCKGRKIGDCRDIHRSSYIDDGDGRRICKYGGDCRNMLWCNFKHPM